MFKALRRIWRYIGTAIGMRFDELADPKVQLTQAIDEAQDQHRKLKQQAANVIANQKQTEMRLNRAMGDLEKTAASARQAVLLADKAQHEGDGTDLAEYTRVAEALATRMVTLEEEIQGLKDLHLQTTRAAESAKQAVQQNATALQKRIAERQKLLSQLDQAKMQEQVNRAMGQLAEQVGQDVPTFEQVRTKIEERYAKALAAAEVNDQSTELKMLEMEQAAKDAEARAKLEHLRSQLGLPQPSSTGSELAGPSASAAGAIGAASSTDAGAPRPSAAEAGPADPDEDGGSTA